MFWCVIILGINAPNEEELGKTRFCSVFDHLYEHGLRYSQILCTFFLRDRAKKKKEARGTFFQD